jgi:hypothetical protein
LQELAALAVYLAVVFPLREALGVPGVALAYGIGQVIGGLAATVLIARRLGVGPGVILTRAGVPAVSRAVPVVLALAVVEVGLGVMLELPSLIVVIAGAVTAAGVAAVSLWPVTWPELDSVRNFLRRRRGAAPARQ